MMNEIDATPAVAPPASSFTLEKTHTANTQILPFQFTGNGIEYFKIWIVNILLSIVTLGIYSAWATVRTKRYFYGNTIFDQASFEYHATPIQILKGRIIALILVVLYVVLTQLSPTLALGALGIILVLTPWAVWSGLRFNAHMSSYRNVRFGFTGQLKRAYWIMLLLPAIPILIGVLIGGALFGFNSLEFLAEDTAIFLGSGLMIMAVLVFYMIMPYIQKLYTEYYINHSHYGQGQFNALLETKTYYKIYLKLLLIGIALYIVIGLLVTAAAFPIMLMLGSLGSSEPSIGMIIIMTILGGLFYFFLIAVGLWFTAYLKVRLRNYSYSLTQLDTVLRLHSNASSTSLWGIYVLNLFLLMITLGLAYPWNKVRLARYEAQTLAAEVAGSLDHYVSQRQAEQSSLGDQIGDVFDLPVSSGLGL